MLVGAAIVAIMSVAPAAVTSATVAVPIAIICHWFPPSVSNQRPALFELFSASLFVSPPPAVEDAVLPVPAPPSSPPPVVPPEPVIRPVVPLDPMLAKAPLPPCA